MPANIRKMLIAAVMIGAAPPAFADVITDWNEKGVAYVTGKMAPAAAQRIMAITHVAMFDAVNSIERRYRPYLVQLPAGATTSKEAAAAAAAGTALAALNPQAEVEFKGAMAAYLAGIPDGESKTQGIALGEAVAGKVLAARANDGSEAPDSYRPKTRPGVYVPTPSMVSSTWPNLKPFALKSQSQFRPGPPISLKSTECTKDYNEIKTFGARNSTKRSARQTEDARFWLITGPQSTDPIVRQIVIAKKMSLIDSARFMAVVTVTAADAGVAVFDAKYQYDFWRPVTAIRNGDIDDNPATERDAAWQPIADTPMHPEYPCAHCIISNSVASAVEALLGTAEIPEVVMTSPTAPGATHRFTNIRAYADEVAQARIWAGFHYRFSTRVGQDMGRKVGQYVVDNVMRSMSVAGTQ
jgi:hypothetical protein